MKKSSKKICLLLMVLLSSLGAFAVDLQFRVQPYMNIPLASKLTPSFGISGAVDLTPITVRGRDSIHFSLQGSYGILSADKIADFFFLDASLGASYEFRPFDRFSFEGGVTAGLWTVPKSDENKLPSALGYSLGAKVSANFYVFPFLTAGVFAGYKFLGSDVPFLNSVELGASVRFNLTKALISTSDVKTLDMEISPLFPVFYSYYDSNKFGTIHFINNEKNKINNVQVSIFIEEFMTNETVIATFDSIAMGEDFSVDLTAFLNESILNTIMQHETNAKVVVTYKNIGLTSTYTENIKLYTLGRNNMSWEDDARAATFVSGNDASAKRFARFVQLVLKNRLTESESVNIQYARGIFAALKAYGINYVIDPSSAFADNIGSANIDFLQFPYQTLLYHGGDCDDLTILNCSLLEAMGVETALITVPGHIYMAFDSGYSIEETDRIADGNFIIYNDKVWIPVEITMCQDTFQKAKIMGMHEWNKAGENAAMIPVHEAWQTYNPVSIPDSDVNFELPDGNKVIKNLK